MCFVEHLWQCYFQVCEDNFTISTGEKLSSPWNNLFSYSAADPGGGAKGAMGPAPPPVPVKTSHKKDGHHRRPLIFHVSWPPPLWPCWIRCCYCYYWCMYKNSFLRYLTLLAFCIIDYHSHRQIFFSDFTGDGLADLLCVPKLSNSSRSLAIGESSGSFRVSLSSKTEVKDFQ